MKQRMVAFGTGLLLILSASIIPAMAAEVSLHIPPVVQDRTSWSWAAVGEMVFKYYSVPAAHQTDYQCGIAQSRKFCSGIPNCGECDSPAADDVAMAHILAQYPVLATKGGTAGDIALTVQSKTGSLSEAEVKKELKEGRPIIVGLSPAGFKVDGSAQHMALIIGYDDGYGDLMLTVNDPFPFEDERFQRVGNPYHIQGLSGGSDGQYEIGLERFRSRLKWTQTMYRTTCTGRDCPPDNHRVVRDSAWKDDSKAIHTVLAASSGDFKTLRTGHKAVDLATGTTWQSSVIFSGAKQCLVRDKDDFRGAEWSCIFKFADRSEADKLVEDMLERLRSSLPPGWTGTDLNEDSDAELYTRTDKFSTFNPGSHSTLSLYLIDSKKDRRVKMYLSVSNK